MRTASSIEQEQAWRAESIADTDPSTPAGFLRLFDIVAFSTVLNTGLFEAHPRNTGVWVRRRKGQSEMAAYLQAAVVCSRGIEGQLVSPDGLAQLVHAHVQTLDLNRWFELAAGDVEPEVLATHYVKYTDVLRGGQETLELLPDAFLPAHLVHAEYEKFVAFAGGEDASPGASMH